MNSHLSFHLSDEFVNGYADREVEWGFDIGGGNSLGELTYLTKYSRVKDDGTKERWHETCQRVVEGTYSILKDHCKYQNTSWNSNKAQRSAEDAYERLFTFKWTPPGRGLWMMGSQFVSENGSAALQNCFAAETEIITDVGRVKIGDVAGTMQRVLTTNGKWVDAPIRSFGSQSLMKVTLSRVQGETKTIYATPDHRWFVTDRRTSTRYNAGKWIETPTKDLRPGVSRMREVFGSGLKHTQPSPFGVAHGFTYGDGRLAGGEKSSNTVTLFGEKDKALSKYFELCTSRYNPASIGGIEYGQLPNFFKELPSFRETKSYLYGWLAGYFAADGYVGKTGAPQLSSASLENMEFVRDLCFVIGVGTYGIRSEKFVSNLDGQTHDRHRLTFMRDTLTEEFFLVDEHRARWAEGADSKRYHWKVTGVETTDRFEEVFCATVEGSGTFTLADNILTGNCAFLSTEHLGVRNATGPFVRLMEMSMLGIGVGFDTRGAGKLTLQEPREEKIFYTVEDSREGWYKSTELVLDAYLRPGSCYPVNDYSLVRDAGEPIRGFGGKAAGPEPLIKLHDALHALLGGRGGQLITSSDIVDINNLIGKCVVAGNVRRSAEIAFGEPDDQDFLDLKSWELNPERMGADGWGHLSNNSIFAEVGGNYDHLVERIASNGEPGLNYLGLARKYGRLIDPVNNKDYRALGANPCAEQTLEDNECCTLVETYPIHHETQADFLRTIKAAYLYAKAVTLLPTHWPETNEVMTRNHRIGTSMSGIVQFAEQEGWTELRTWSNAAYEEVSSRDVQYSEWLGVRESIKMTSVKPSGTVSLLAGVTPGVHWPVANDDYVRRQRFRTNDPVLAVIANAGYHAEPDFMDPDHTMVVAFPTSGPHVRSERDVSVWEKVALAVLMQRYWADNQVSATFTFKPEEKEQIGAILRAFDGQLKSLSFLPIQDGTGYRQLPYEQITPRLFEAMRRGVTNIDWDTLYRDGEAPEGERFCNNDTCTI